MAFINMYRIENNHKSFSWREHTHLPMAFKSELRTSIYGRSAIYKLNIVI